MDLKLFQEDLVESPFWLVVGCVLVNVTTWRVARHAHETMRSRWPTPEDLALAPTSELEDLLRPLGLFRRRSATLRALASAWVASPPGSRRDVERLPGCGRYAADSWSVFVERDHDVEVSDKKLLAYLARSDVRGH